MCICLPYTGLCSMIDSINHCNKSSSTPPEIVCGLANQLTAAEFLKEHKRLLAKVKVLSKLICLLFPSLVIQKPKLKFLNTDYVLYIMRVCVCVSLLSVIPPHAHSRVSALCRGSEENKVRLNLQTVNSLCSINNVNDQLPTITIN